MITERRCGLKYFDQAVAKTSKSGIIDEMVNLLNQFYRPNPAHPLAVNWKNCEWAFGNAIAKILNKPQVSISFNLDDVFDTTEMQIIATRAGADIKSYAPSWPRK